MQKPMSSFFRMIYGWAQLDSSVSCESVVNTFPVAQNWNKTGTKCMRRNGTNGTSNGMLCASHCPPTAAAQWRSAKSVKWTKV